MIFQFFSTHVTLALAGLHTKFTVPKQVNPIPAPLRILFSLPSKLASVRLTNLVINTTLALFVLDAFRPELASSHHGDAPHDLLFARVGAVYSDAVKIHVRYPNLKLDEHIVSSEQQQSGVGVLKVLWREAVSGASESTVGMWKDGPVLQLSEENDWVGVAQLQKLWPSTSYQCEPLDNFLALWDCGLIDSSI